MAPPMECQGRLVRHVQLQHPLPLHVRAAAFGGPTTPPGKRVQAHNAGAPRWALARVRSRFGVSPL
jgi:hypothetical protein